MAGAACARRWIPCVVVDDVDAAAKRAVALGGGIAARRRSVSYTAMAEMCGPIRISGVVHG